MTDSTEPLEGRFVPAPINEGGDNACWLNRVCEDCGALIEDDKATTCWRCGAPWDPDS